MILNAELYRLFIEKAQEVQVDTLCLGLGYTAVATSDGGIGLAYTYFEDKKSCMVLNETIDYEGQPAADLL
jgi:predicted methyltransferase